MQRHITMTKDNFEAVNTKILETNLDGEAVLEVHKTEKLMVFDENTYAKLKHFSFKNGTIEVSVRSRLLPDAPDFARGFIGIAFRISEDNEQFESFYVRPTNGNHEDSLRASRASQYFAYPNYKFDYFREQGIADYEAPAAISLDEWIDIRAEILDERAVFYINGQETLRVNDLKLGEEAVGSIGLFVDIGTQGFFKDLEVTVYDEY